MPYEVRLSRRASRQLDRLPDRQADRILEAIVRLGTDPFPAASKQLAGRGPSRRLRVGDYRVLYTVFQPDKLLSIDAVWRRTSTTYKDKS